MNLLITVSILKHNTMLFDRFKCKKNKTKKKQNKTESITPKVSKTNNCKAVILSKWATYGSK